MSIWHACKIIGFVAALSACGVSSAADRPASRPEGTSGRAVCSASNADLKLPPGFCATIFADGIGHARHLTVAPDGVVYVNTWSGRYYGFDKAPQGGFLLALQDTTGAGKANVIERFGPTVQSGAAGGTGIALYDGVLYAELNDEIVRYPLPAGAIVPRGDPIVVVRGLPLSGDHPMHPFIIDRDGALYVDVATATNACQSQNRIPGSKGIRPCAELKTRGGIWRFDARGSNQEFSPATRFATGIRNAEGFAIEPDGQILVTQHGRDQLHANWPRLYKPEEEATQPAETLLLLKQGGDYGWPECYYDAIRGKLVLAPEYGGNGGTAIGECASKRAPLAAFPAHWAPNAMVRYTQTQFPERYRRGVFVAFHGSWDRAPYPQGGYNVVFQPLVNDQATAPCEIFADGFAGAAETPDQAQHRPSGLAVGPDGALYVSEDLRGRIYRITYQSGPGTDGEAGITRCPGPDASAGSIGGTPGTPPEGTHPDAGASASAELGALPVPSGATRAIVALGDRVYHGQVGGAPCTGCHGVYGAGTVLGPSLTAGHWLWSDGSYQGIERTIAQGVPQPRQFRSPMPPMGGAQLTPQQLSAVAAYAWALGHEPGATARAHPTSLVQ